MNSILYNILHWIHSWENSNILSCTTFLLSITLSLSFSYLPLSIAIDSEEVLSTFRNSTIRVTKVFWYHIVIKSVLKQILVCVFSLSAWSVGVGSVGRFKESDIAPSYKRTLWRHTYVYEASFGSLCFCIEYCNLEEVFNVMKVWSVLFVVVFCF